MPFCCQACGEELTPADVEELRNEDGRFDRFFCSKTEEYEPVNWIEGDYPMAATDQEKEVAALVRQACSNLTSVLGHAAKLGIEVSLQTDEIRVIGRACAQTIVTARIRKVEAL